MSIASAVIVITSMNAIGAPANTQVRPVRFNHTVTASSASAASSWFVAPNTGHTARQAGSA
jgi:hypothetical protein